MYKRVKKYKLQGKTAAHRDSLITSQVIELIRAEKIKTTPAKARVLKAEFDKLVTNAKKKTIAGDREVESFFRSNKRSIVRFNKVVDAQLGDRTSGYTRLIKTTPRVGDNADQVYVVLVNQGAKVEKKSKIEKTLETQEKKKKAKKQKKDN
jgi:large subunit ribosomal protein L17